MKTLTIRVPDALVAEIEAESRARSLSKSDIARERLSKGTQRSSAVSLDAIADLVGSVEGLPADLSSTKKQQLEATGYGRKRHR
jgi:hypothetical protein